jgi:predicted metal-binding protein
VGMKSRMGKPVSDRRRLESAFRKHGCTDFKWIDPREIVTAQWVRVKCMYGCEDYGRRACCPPNAPSVAECRRFFDEYHTGVLFHLPVAGKNAEDRRKWRKVNRALVSLEREVFLLGYERSFMLLMGTCSLCRECTGVRDDCKHPSSARPTVDAFAVDVYSTVRKYGFPIQVLTDYSDTMNRYAFLLVE